MSSTATQTTPAQQIRKRIESDGKIRVVDLFCGAGGMSWGLAKALESIAAEFDRPIEDIIELHAVNHWDVAIETHQQNHPWAAHYNCPVQELNPTDVVPRGDVTLLTGGWEVAS